MEFFKIEVMGMFKDSNNKNNGWSENDKVRMNRKMFVAYWKDNALKRRKGENEECGKGLRRK